MNPAGPDFDVKLPTRCFSTQIHGFLHTPVDDVDVSLATSGNIDRYLDFDLAIGSGLYSTSQVAIPSRIVALRPGKFQVEMQRPQVMFLGIGCAHLLETWWILGLYMYHLVS